MCTRESGQASLPGVNFYSVVSTLLWPRINHLIPSFEGSLFGKVCIIIAPFSVAVLRMKPALVPRLSSSKLSTALAIINFRDFC